jgi:hypothetical protein
MVPDYNYPDEDCIKPSFVRKVMKARGGTGKDFSNLEDIEDYLS